MANQKVQLTKKGFETLKKELEELKKKRPSIVRRLSRARAEGDLKENSDYHSARDELGFLDGRIEELEQVVNNASVVNDATGVSGVAVGTTVTLKVNGNEVVYHIVGEWEADPMKKKISHTSPLGQALSGKLEGDKVEVEAPVGKVVYEIVSIK